MPVAPAAGVGLAGAELSACGGAAPWPSSAFMLREVVVDRRRATSARAAGDRCRPGPAVSDSWSSNAPEASSSSIALARARMFSVLSTARCIAMPTSAISSPTPDAASEIFTEASAAEYCALMTSFLVRNWSIFVRSVASLSISAAAGSRAPAPARRAPAARPGRTACAPARRARDPRGSARAPGGPACRA